MGGKLDGLTFCGGEWRLVVGKCWEKLGGEFGITGGLKMVEVVNNKGWGPASDGWESDGAELTGGNWEGGWADKFKSFWD